MPSRLLLNLLRIRAWGCNVCGLFAVIARNATLKALHVEILLSAGRIGQRRGSDASGLVVVDDSTVEVVKSDSGFKSLCRSTDGRALIDSVENRSAWLMAGHSRLETHGFSARGENNQPVVVGEWTVLHNGIITNETALRSVLSIDDLATAESDTAVIAALFDAWDRNGRSEPIETVLDRLEGEYSIIALSTGGDVVASSNVGNLYRLDDGDTVLLVSEPRQLPRGNAEQATRLPLGEVVTLRERDGQLRSIAAKNVRPATRQSAGATGLHLEESAIPLEFKERIVALNERALARSAALRRCTRCILPETFPGIDFDEDGVCSVCRAFAPPTYSGLDALERDLRAASPDGRTVLVCLSGGRDSCYILHLIVEMGLEPIAYTYDWGMVTTAARENMARMCGQLGVEHILVSPDIRRNRRRIHRALDAWLSHPKVGTLPILMAGDKPYFRFAGIVGEERGGLPAVMADHPLETTGFKSALAGAVPTTGDDGGVSYRLGGKSLARMVGSYLAHGLRSPGLLPSLFAEGAVGFFDYYVRNHTFIRPFSYIPWDEDELEETLRDRYGWSSGSDRSTSSWRMGDGTAPFYNLMYLIALGMTEHDALRSNQIRFGLLERGDALSAAAKDNITVPLGLASYFATVEIDLAHALDRIEAFAQTST